jgi:hypothetical protein
MDHTDERHARLREVTCGRCLAQVAVAKFSPQHTSVQWTTDAAATCAEFAGRAAAGEPTALVRTCASLWRSIDDAVRDGRLEVKSP